MPIKSINIALLAQYSHQHIITYIVNYEKTILLIRSELKSKIINFIILFSNIIKIYIYLHAEIKPIVPQSITAMTRTFRRVLESFLS